MRAEAEQLRGLLAADVKARADLDDDNTADQMLTVSDRPRAIDSAGLKQAEAAVAVNSGSSSANGATTADLLAINQLPLTPMPKPHALGFCTFALCALIATVFTTEPHTESTPPKIDALPTIQIPDETRVDRIGVAGISTSGRDMKMAVQPSATDGAESKRDNANESAPGGVVTFASRSYTTSERALAGVFILKRTQDVRGAALVQWAAYSGSADAGIDFSDASGTVRLADGQRQLAIYVPLRNDLLKEQDETFKVCLRSPRHTRIGGTSCAEATIRDDDDASRM